jgi:DNA (cytosine-5)-methyltransferase 1
MILIPKSETIWANYAPDHLYKDITQRNPHKTPPVDFHIAGFPCQPFSYAGKRQGLEDEKGRGQICHYIAEYIEAQRPRVFILENVKGLIDIDQGNTLRAILEQSKSIGK